MNKDWLQHYPFTKGQKEQLRFDVEKMIALAIDKTNKRWVERLAKFSRMGEISEKEVLQDFIKNKSDLLKDKHVQK